MGIIYCLTSPSGKKYIGQTKRSINKRLEEHSTRPDCVYLYNSIQKYGLPSFRVCILVICHNQMLDSYEKEFIQKFNTLYPNGYNIRTGGSNGKHCEASREKMRLSKLGINNHNYGKPRDDTTKLAISVKKSGHLHHFFGTHLTDEHRIKLSKSHQKHSENIPMYVCKIKPRPQCYQSGGYMVDNHPVLKRKYFTSKKFTDTEKYNMALEYLNSYDKNPAQRLNGSGHFE